MKYAVLVVDDQYDVAEHVKKEIETIYPEYFMVDAMDDEMLLGNMQNAVYDVYILDIEMPKISGFAVARQMHEKNPKSMLLFLTTHEELSIDGYEYRAFRFLVKKNMKEMLKKAMDAVLAELEKQRAMVEARNEAKVIVQIPVRDIACVYSEKNYLVLKTEKEMYQTRLSLKEFEERYSMLPFVSPCKGYLVNLMYIASVDCQKDVIYLKNHGTIPISRRRKKAFYAKYAKGI